MSLFRAGRAAKLIPFPVNCVNLYRQCQALRLKLNSLNQTCISLKLLLQLTKTFFFRHCTA